MFLRSKEAKERLLPALMARQPGEDQECARGRDHGFRREFLRHLPFLLPHVDARPWFADTNFAKRSAFQNGTLQVAYLILALRAVGLDTGPMTGFDNAKVDAEFFPEGHVKSNVLINIGYRRRQQAVPAQPPFRF